MARKTTIAVKTLMDNAGLRDGAQEAESVIGGIGKKAAAGLAIAGTAAAAAFGKGFLDAMDQNALGAKFGEDIVARSATIYRDAWGGSLEEVATQFAEAQRAFGDVDNLDQITESAFILAEAFDRDVNASIQDAAELTESFGIDGVEAFDLLTVAMGGLTTEAREELSAATREYGDFFAGLGFSADETLGLLAKFGEGGAMQLDKAGDALKELTIRGTDMSAASKVAFDLMGKDQALYAELLLEGGDAARDALHGIVRGLQEIEDPTEQATAAIALFGTPLEDLGVAQIPAFLETLQGMGDGLEGVEGAAAALGDQLSGSLAAKLESIKRQGLGALADVMEQRVIPAAERVVDWFRANWPQIQATIQTVVENVSAVIDRYWPQIQATIQRVVEQISALVQEHWPQIREIIVTAVEAVQAGIERVTAIVSYIWERWGEDISRYTERWWGAVKEAISGALDVIQGVFRAFKALFEGDWSALWDALKQILSGATTVIKAAAENLWAQVKLAASVAWDLIKTEVWDAIKALPDTIARGHFLLQTAGRNLIGKARDGIVDGFNAIKGDVVAFVYGLPGTIAGVVVDLHSVGFRIFRSFADGILDALSKVPGMIAELVGEPIQKVANQVAGVLAALGTTVPGAGAISGLIVGGGGVDDRASEESRLLKAVVKAKSGPFHEGGTVGPNWSTGNVVGHDEALILAQVGEEVIPVNRTGGNGGGPFIGTLQVLERRTIAEELEIAWLMHGARNN